VISRNLCEMMGGQLHLSSVLGKGTRVDVTLTLALTSAVPANVPVPHVPPARGLNILVVDDYPANRFVAGSTAEFPGASHHLGRGRRPRIVTVAGRAFLTA